MNQAATPKYFAYLRVSRDTQDTANQKLGLPLGRPKGRQGSLKLDGKEEEIAGYLALGLSKRKIAQRLGVAFNTLSIFIKRKALNDRLP